MSGEYNSYGKVFIDGTQDKSVNHSLRQSLEWNKVFDNNEDAWSDVCKLMFSDDITDGIAAFHDYCYEGETPTVMSQNDPNQGWGEDNEDSLLSDTRGEGSEYGVPKPIAGYDVEKSLKKDALKDKVRKAEEDLNFERSVLVMMLTKEDENSDSMALMKKFVESKREKLDKLKEKLESLEA